VWTRCPNHQFPAFKSLITSPPSHKSHQQTNITNSQLLHSTGLVRARPGFKSFPGEQLDGRKISREREQNDASQLSREPTGHKRRRGDDAIQDILDKAASLRLLGPLGVDFGDSLSHDGESFENSLDASLRLRSIDSWDIPRLRSALTWWGAFITASPSSSFVPAIGNSAVSGGLLNRLTLDRFGEFIRRSPPLGRTTDNAPCTANVIQGYQSAIKLVRSREARYDIAPDWTDVVMPLALKSMRGDDGPRGDRKLSLGLRASDFDVAQRSGFDRKSKQGASDWAMGLLSHNVYLRGGEAGCPDHIDPDSRRVLTWGNSIQPQRPRAESLNRPWFLLWIVPIKDTNHRAKAHPTPVQRRHDGPFGADPLCTFDALLLHALHTISPPGTQPPVSTTGVPLWNWLELLPRKADAPSPNSPIFTQPDGRIVRTSYVRTFARSLAEAAGFTKQQIADTGAKAFRVGGSTDTRAKLGEAGKDHIKARGRWASDVAEAYQRPLLAHELDASAAVGAVQSIDLEKLCEGAFAAPRR